jgi:arylsulfatase A-like enzyme
MLIVALACVIGSCAAPDTRSVEVASARNDRWMSGSIVTDRDIIVAPNTQWNLDSDRRQWRFLASSTLAVWVQRELPFDLYLSFDVTVGRPHEIHPSWDGIPLDQASISVSDTSLDLRIPTEALTPGTHALALVRTDAAGLAGDTDSLRFGEIRWKAGDTETTLDPQQIHAYRYVASFLLQGVTGSFSTERLGGVLFLGSGARRFPLPGPSLGEFRFRVQNSAPEPVRFHLASGQNRVTVEVESHAKRDLSVQLDPESRHLELEVEGPRGGFYLWGAPHIEIDTEPDHPPIVLVTIDTTRRDAVPPWSAQPDLTPNLKRFAGEATVYTRAASTSPWTLPAHASMFTGWFPSRHRAGVTNQEVGAHHSTVAELLAEAGVPSVGIAGGFLCKSRFGLAQGFSIYHDPESFEVRGDQIADLAIGALDRFGALHPFIFANFFDPHFAYQAPDEYRRLTGADRLTAAIPKGSFWRDVLDGDGDAWRRANIEDIEFTGSVLAALDAEYRAEVAFMDNQIGRIFEALQSQGLYQKALIVIVADHGELLGEHRIIGHGGRLDPELVEVPLLVKYPHQSQSIRVDDLVSVVDIFPTLLHWAGVEALATDGHVLPTTAGTQSAARDFVFSEEHVMGIHELFGRMLVANRLFGVERRLARELVWDTGHQCFERAQSLWQPVPCEQSDAMSVVTQHLDPPDILAGQQVSGLDADEREKLRALGYIQ